MKKIEFTKVPDIYNPQKTKNVNNNNYSLPEDKFVKKDSMDTKKIENYDKISKMFGNRNYPDMSESLLKEGYWSDSINNVSFNTKNDLIDSVNLSVLDVETSKNREFNLSIDEFCRLYTRVTAYAINRAPEEEENYKKMFIKLLSFIEKNKIKE